MIEKIDIVKAAGVGHHEVLFKNAVEAMSDKLNEVIDAVNQMPQWNFTGDAVTRMDVNIDVKTKE